jgi:hypothetical protein
MDAYTLIGLAVLSLLAGLGFKPARALWRTIVPGRHEPEQDRSQDLICRKR